MLRNDWCGRYYQYYYPNYRSNSYFKTQKLKLKDSNKNISFNFIDLNSMRLKIFYSFDRLVFL
jgi:hypothetical protein